MSKNIVGAIAIALPLALLHCHREPGPTTAKDVPSSPGANENPKEASRMSNVTLLTTALPKEWYQAGDRPIFLADVLDETSASPMSVGFAKYGAGASNDWTVSYDEVLVITRGTFSVVAGGKVTTARAGEAIFLPKGTQLTYRAEDEAELVYVSYPHWAEATRKSGHAPALEFFHPVPPAATQRAR